MVTYVAGVNFRFAKKTNIRTSYWTFDDTFGRFGGGKELGVKLRSTKLFVESGKKSFEIQTGPGFAGKSRAGLASMETFHRYKQYKAMIRYKKHGSYRSYSGNGLYYPKSYRQCYGGCHGHSFCDFGICRCYYGLYPSHGSCWSTLPAPMVDTYR